MKRLTTCLALALFAFAGVNQAKAQFYVGPRIGFDLGDAEGLIIGGDAMFFPASLPVGIQVGVDYYFIDEDDFFGRNIGDADINYTVINLTANGIYEFGVDNETFTPYAGGGLVITYASVGGDDVPNFIDDSDTDLGLNLVAGSYFMLGSVEPYVQANIKVGGDFDIFSLLLGLRFPIGGQ